MNTKNILTLAFSTAILTSCGGGGGGGGSATGTSTQPLETELTGIYQGILSPLNKTLSGHLNGSVTIIRDKDDVVIDVRIASGPVSTIHSQNIHIGDRCPTEADDTNGDGYVDGEEASAIVKEILIPLDDDISSQWMGLGTFPVTDEFGYYFWSRAAPYQKMMADLRDVDINLKDEYVKIGADKALTMIGKVVLIRGVPDATPLPETVQGHGRLSPQAGLPIACAPIKRIGSVPGVIDPDRTDIPVPTGETIGGSSGADDGADFSHLPTTGGGVGNYGDDREDLPTTTTGGTNGSNRVEPVETGRTTAGFPQ